MRRLPTIAIAVLLIPMMTLATVPAVPGRHIDDDGPAQGVRPLELRELWRVGGEDGDLIFGRIVDVERHDDGCVYVLDNQLCQVVVISPDGRHLRDLSRSGEGPGELRQPMGLVFLPDGVLGVGMGYPGKVVTMTLDGVPLATHYPIGEPADGNVGIMINVQYVDGVLVASGGRIVFQGPTDSHTDRFLSVSVGGLDTFERVLERATPIDPTGREYDEADDYYIDRSWALGPEGRIYAPLSRDRYEVSVVDASGELLQVFGREERPRRRTADEKDEVGPLINVSNEEDRSYWTIADHDESVSRILYNHDDDTIWVLTPNGTNDQPDGILESWDVFGTGGEYLRQVPIPLGHEMNDGTCYLVGGGRLVVVKGTGSSFHGTDVDDEELEALEVICYEMQE